jgi:AmiR/NasT family two-component response regulator
MNDKLSDLVAKFTSFLFDNSLEDNNDTDDCNKQKDLILLITRNINNQHILEKIITRANYNFIQANSLKIAQSFDFQHKYGKPDLIILDLDKKTTEFEMFSLKLSNNVPVIRFVDSKTTLVVQKSIQESKSWSKKDFLIR